jgi:ABC-type multidrug transport system ATPase subunit
MNGARWGLQDVRLTRGRTVALDGVTLPADPGQISAVVGGDGAGKTSCLQVLAGLAEPDSGAVRRPARERIGYVPATSGLYADLTVAENMDFTARAYRIAGGERAPRAGELLSLTGLAQVRDRLGGHLSGGMQRKLALAMALLHAPELLILDEPTTGVDPVSRADLWRLITRTAAGGTAVAVATTYVNEAARAAHVVLLEAGRAVASGSPGDILRSVPGALGVMGGDARPAPLSWRRGASWRVWAPSGTLPDGAAPVEPDFQDAVVAATLAGDQARAGSRAGLADGGPARRQRRAERGRNG